MHFHCNCLPFSSPLPCSLSLILLRLLLTLVLLNGIFTLLVVKHEVMIVTVH